jgi:hypothetical protein
VLPGYPLSPSLFNDLPSALKVTGVSTDGKVELACRSVVKRTIKTRIILGYAQIFTLSLHVCCTRQLAVRKHYRKIRLPVRRTCRAVPCVGYCGIHVVRRLL